MDTVNTHVTLAKNYSTFRSSVPPSLPPRESSASASLLHISKKQLIASYCACFGKKEPILNKRTVEPFELATYIASFRTMPRADKTEIQYHIVRITSCILDRAEQEKTLMRTKRENFHSFEKRCQQFEDAYIDGDALEAAFYFETLHNKAYAAIYPIPMLTALHKSYTGRKILPPLLLGALDALESEGLTLETAIKTYYALEARGELDCIEVIETPEQASKRGPKIDWERIKHTEDACKRVLAKYGKDDKIKQADFRREVTVAMGEVKAHQDTVTQEWANIPSSRKYQNCPPKAGQRKISS